jgi:MFS family permease
MLVRTFFRRRTTDAKQLPPLGVRIGILTFALLQNALAGGLIFGWASIDGTLLISEESNGGAGVPPEKTTLVFSWASSLAMVSSFFLGIVLDIFGPRACSVICLGSIAIGSRLLATSHNFTQFSIGACAVSFGGPGICGSIIHIANLFPTLQNLVMSLLSGSIAISFSVFSLFDILWHRYEFATFHALFGYYSWLAAALALGGFLFYPDEPYKEMTTDEPEEEMAEQRNSDVTPLIRRSSSSMASPRTVLYTPELPVVPEHDHHLDPHNLHIQSAATPSLKIEQPLNTYLRLKGKTESFRESAEAMRTQDPEAAVLISLKDQPFFKQLFSATYLRSSVLFWLCTFITNFFVSSLSKELADFHQYTHSVQHELAETFTLFMSLGVLASVLAGFLIDLFGVEICTVMTLVFGQLEMFILILFGNDRAMMTLSFFCYTMFRSFLYPVFIASLTSRLGFKYFGILLGMGFAISGIGQLLMAPLAGLVQGDCHLTGSDIVTDDGDCFSGLWLSLHYLELFVLLALMAIPFMDHRAKIGRETAIREYHARHPRNDSSVFGLPVNEDDNSGYATIS